MQARSCRRGLCRVENYNNVVKTPAPGLAGGRPADQGPQRALVSPEAIGSLIVTKRRTLIAVSGSGGLLCRGVTLMSDDPTNVTRKT
ncbi:hypothetical protein ACNKHU_11645 [Shigella flexneri]